MDWQSKLIFLLLSACDPIVLSNNGYRVFFKTLSQQFKMHIYIYIWHWKTPLPFQSSYSANSFLYFCCSSLSLATSWSHQLCQIAGLFKERCTKVCMCSLAQICNPDFIFFFFFSLNVQVPISPFSSFSHLQTTDLLVDYTKPFKQTWLYSLNDFMWILPSR